MRTLFMGTPEFAVPSLEALAASGAEVVAVVCQPDRPAGRGLRLRPPPVKVAATGHGLRVLQPARLREPEFCDLVTGSSLDLVLVAAYGKILPGWFLETPRLGCVNVHASLLPRLRGASPIHRAVLSGETRSGITLMQMDRGLDTGPILVQEGFELDPRETAGSLHDRLAELGGQMVAAFMPRLARGDRPEPRPQLEEQATQAPKLDPTLSEIDWSRAAVDVDRRIRGLTPFPGAHSWLQGTRLKILEARIGPTHRDGRDPTAAAEPTGAAPGTVVAAGPDALVIATGTGTIEVVRLQRAGRRVVTAREFLAGHAVREGQRFTGAGVAAESGDGAPPGG